jgi:hypothetical protein
MNLTAISRFYKAHIALVGVAATWYLATYPNGQYVKYVAAGVGLLTALGVLVVPNKKVKTAGHTVTRRRIPETVVEGKPLGRHVHHDSRSLAYLVPAMSKRQQRKVTAVRWDRVIPVLDQGQVGSCTGNAATGALGTDPNYPPLEARPTGVVLTEATALALYSKAEDIDGDGPFPPNDNGSSGLSVAKAAKNAGLIDGYLHVTSIAAALTAIQTGPFIVGSDWWTSFDTPDSNGLVAIAKGATVRGGHEYECIGYDPATDLWELVNSWGTVYGVGGHFYYSTATFKALLAAQGDATVFTPLAAPVPAPTPPTPVSGAITITDPALVTHLDALATKAGETPQQFTEARLRKLYPSA